MQSRTCNIAQTASTGSLQSSLSQCVEVMLRREINRRRRRWRGSMVMGGGGGGGGVGSRRVLWVTHRLRLTDAVSDTHIHNHRWTYMAREDFPVGSQWREAVC